MKEQLLKLKAEILAELEKVNRPEVWRALKIKYLGRKGELTKILRAVADLSATEKKTLGKLANDIKKEIQEKFEQVKASLEKERKEIFIDATLPGEKI